MAHLTTAFCIKLKDEDHRLSVNPRYLPEHLKLESRVWLEMETSQKETVEEARALIRTSKAMTASERETVKVACPPMGAGGWVFDTGSMQVFHPLDSVRKFPLLENKHTTTNAEDAKSQDSAKVASRTSADTQERLQPYHNTAQFTPLPIEEARSFVRAKDANLEYGSMQGVHPSQY